MVRPLLRGVSYLRALGTQLAWGGSEPVDVRPPDGLLDGPPPEVSIALEMPAGWADALTAAVAAVEQVEHREDPEAIGVCVDGLRALIEQVLRFRVTFAGEDREPTGTVVVEQDIGMLSGKLVGVDAPGDRDVVVRQRVDEVGAGGVAVGVDARSPDRRSDDVWRLVHWLAAADAGGVAALRLDGTANGESGPLVEAFLHRLPYFSWASRIVVRRGRDAVNALIDASPVAATTSIYRADDQMLVNPHVYGQPAAQAPVLHLRQISGGRLVTTYLDSFERVWSEARPID